jgi:hypothetical protein
MIQAGRATTTAGRKLTATGAVAIRGMRMLGFTRQAIAGAFGVGMTTVQWVLSGMSWQNAIDDELDKDIERREREGEQVPAWWPQWQQSKSEKSRE